MCVNNELININSIISSEYESVPNTLKDEDKKYIKRIKQNHW